MSCASFKDIPYSYPEENMEAFSTIYFTRANPGYPGVEIISIDNTTLPTPNEKELWNPIKIPANTEITLNVHAYYHQQSSSILGVFIAANRTIDQIVEFVCPPLESDKEYIIDFIKGIGISGKNTLRLRDKKTKKTIKELEFIKQK